jgi:hypothetical protein
MSIDMNATAYDSFEGKIMKKTLILVMKVLAVTSALSCMFVQAAVRK